MNALNDVFLPIIDFYQNDVLTNPGARSFLAGLATNPVTTDVLGAIGNATDVVGPVFQTAAVNPLTCLSRMHAVICFTPGAVPLR